MKVKIDGRLTHTTHLAAKTAVVAIFAGVEVAKAIYAKTLPMADPKLSEDLLYSRPVTNWVECVAKQTEFALEVADPKLAAAVIAKLEREGQIANVTLMGLYHICRHGDADNTACVTIPLGVGEGTVFDA